MTKASSISLPGPQVATPATPAPRRFKLEGWIAVIVAMVLWQQASRHFPPFLFPPLQNIATTFFELLSNGTLLETAGHTYLRIIVALSLSFVFSTALGIGGGLSAAVDRVILPFVQFKQAVPSICWIIFSILWFKDVEVRIAFIIVVSTMPSLYYLTRDGVRAIPAELWDMMRAWRPSHWQMITKLILPAVLPVMATGLRINIGTATRVAIFAELLGGISGVGYHLRIAEEQFRMDAVMAWTIVLVALVLVSEKLTAFLERRLLASRGRWKPEA